jgi:carbon-monoxide dehydrogenase small subunit
LVLAADAQDCRIVTTEGLSPAVGVNEIQDALLSRSGVQCGFCTPGFVVAITALLAKNPQPNKADVREGLAGNLCRCTGYQSILDAVLSISEGNDDDA